MLTHIKNFIHSLQKQNVKIILVNHDPLCQRSLVWWKINPLFAELDVTIILEHVECCRQRTEWSKGTETLFTNTHMPYAGLKVVFFLFLCFMD